MSKQPTSATGVYTSDGEFKPLDADSAALASTNAKAYRTLRDTEATSVALGVPGYTTAKTRAAERARALDANADDGESKRTAAALGEDTTADAKPAEPDEVRLPKAEAEQLSRSDRELRRMHKLAAEDPMALLSELQDLGMSAEAIGSWFQHELNMSADDIAKRDAAKRQRERDSHEDRGWSAFMAAVAEQGGTEFDRDTLIRKATELAKECQKKRVPYDPIELAGATLSVLRDEQAKVAKRSTRAEAEADRQRAEATLPPGQLLRQSRERRLARLKINRYE